jgi:glyoxylase-like metal-dependent hydrolase (beta-lactamase superfamily II)
MFGFNYDQPLDPKKFVKEGDIIKFGNSSLKVIYTPGHTDGSISLWSKKEKFIIVGDILFNNGVGRTDLPTGNPELLKNSIFNKLFVLDDDTIVYPGHGSKTTIGAEKNHLIL